VALLATAKKIGEGLLNFAQSKDVSISVSGEEVQIQGNQSYLEELFFNLIETRSNTTTPPAA
jgi:hypothetical protein